MASGLQRANPALSTVDRAPQTTGDKGTVGPFVRSSHRARLAGFDVTGQAFGALVTQPLKAVGGYYKDLQLLIKASGGGGTTTNATAAADAPDNAIASFILRDPFGEPIVQTDGYGLRLIDMYGLGYPGILYTRDPHNLPSYSAVATSGNFIERFVVPIDLLSDAYCALAGLNAAAVPQVQIQLAAAATVFTTSPSPTVPTVEVRVDQTYWAAPINDPSLAPPGVGSSSQWSQSNAAQQIGSASAFNLTLPRVGTYIHSLILIGRDSTGARVDTWMPAAQGNPFEFWVDQTPWLSEPIDIRFDTMTRFSGAGAVAPSDARPTGVVAYAFGDSTMEAVSRLDTGDEFLRTTPGTLLEIRSTSNTISSNTPVTVAALTGELYPVGGIPYAHLME